MRTYIQTQGICTSGKPQTLFLASLHPASALCSTTIAALHLNICIQISNLIDKVIIVVSQLLQGKNVFRSKEHYVGFTLVLVIIEDILSIKVRGTTMVDEPPHIPTLCCIDCETLILHNFTRT